MKVQIGILSLVAIAAASLGVSPASAILSTPSPTPAFSQASAVTTSPTFASTGAPVLAPTPVASPSQSASGLAPNPSANPTPSSSPIPSTTAPSARPTSGPSVSPRPTPSTKPTPKPTSAPTPTPTAWAPDPKVLEALLIAKEAELRYQIALLTIEQFESTPKYDAAAHCTPKTGQRSHPLSSVGQSQITKASSTAPLERYEISRRICNGSN